MFSNVSGSLYPSKEVINDQFKIKQEERCSIGFIDLPERVFVDLGRLHTLVVNEESIYNKLGYEAQLTEASKATFVFEQVEQHCESTQIALNAVALMEQGLGGSILRSLSEKKQWTNVEEATSTRTSGEKRCINRLTINDHSFKIIHEGLVQTRDMGNPEDETRCTWLKVKTVISGSRSALEQGNSNLMKIEAAYTKEHRTEIGALNDSYAGTRVGGLFNCESYITD